MVFLYINEMHPTETKVHREVGPKGNQISFSMDTVLLRSIFDQCVLLGTLNPPTVYEADVKTLLQDIPVRTTALVGVKAGDIAGWAYHSLPPCSEWASFRQEGSAFKNTILEILICIRAFEMIHKLQCVDRVNPHGWFGGLTPADDETWAQTWSQLCGKLSAGNQPVLVWMERWLRPLELWNCWKSMRADGIFIQRVPDFGVGMNLAALMVQQFEVVQWVAPVESNFPQRNIYLVGFRPKQCLTIDQMMVVGQQPLETIQVPIDVRDSTLRFVYDCRLLCDRSLARAVWLRPFIEQTPPSQPFPIDVLLFRKVPIALHQADTWEKVKNVLVKLHEYKPT
jgi:hypothetical protein